MTRIFRQVLLALALALFAGSGGGIFVPPVHAQEAASTPDFDQWDRFAASVESAVEAGDTENQTLEQLREDLTEWRETFVGAQNANSGSIATVQRQLDALGPAPEDGGESPKSRWSASS